MPVEAGLNYHGMDTEGSSSSSSSPSCSSSDESSESRRPPYTNAPEIFDESSSSSQSPSYDSSPSPSFPRARLTRVPTTSQAPPRSVPNCQPRAPSKSPPSKLHADELKFTNGAQSFNEFEKISHPKHRNKTHQRGSLAYGIDNDLVSAEDQRRLAEQRDWFHKDDDGKSSPQRAHEARFYDNFKANDGVVADATPQGDQDAKTYRDARRCPKCSAAFRNCDCELPRYEPVYTHR